MRNKGERFGPLQESMIELRQATVELWYAVVYDIGRGFLALGYIFTDAAIKTDRIDNVLEALKRRQLDVVLAMEDDFSEQLQKVIAEFDGLE